MGQGRFLSRTGWPQLKWPLELRGRTQLLQSETELRTPALPEISSVNLYMCLHLSGL